MHLPTPLARAWPLAGLLLLTSLASHAATDGDTLMQKGGANPAAMPCISCHAPDGKGMAAAGRVWPACRPTTSASSCTTSRPGGARTG
jgi:cytochrome c553